MNQFHFLRDFKKAFFMSAFATVLISLALFLLPRYFVYGAPETFQPEITTMVEIIEKEVSAIEEEDLDSWIEDNFDKSIEFYTEQITNDSQISRAIISNSIKNGIPVNLAFSVAYKESKFDKKAYNDNGKSKDRGLFQLNDSYRKDWPIEDFYNIDKNSFEGTRYLKEMIVLNENDIQKALYCYNAGPTKVRRDGIIPDRTRIYAAEILNLEKKMNQQLQNWIIN